MRKAVLLVLLFGTMFGVLGYMLQYGYRHWHEPTCPCEMVKNRECLKP